MVIVIIGVSGAGKSTIAAMLAEQLGWPYLDADDYHPAANIEKMRQGIALTDADRMPWLDDLAARIAEFTATGNNAILACSALKQAYRDRLEIDQRRVCSVLLAGSPALLTERLSQREQHFMPTHLLQSQLATLELPEDGLTVDIGQSPAAICDQIKTTLAL